MSPALAALLGLAGALAALAAGGLGYAAWQVRWLRRHTRGTAYFGLPEAGRRALKEEVRRRARRMVPLSRALVRVLPLPFPTCTYRGVRGPGVLCSRRSFARAAAFRPGPGDVFVATQMKCGTTWMQQVVYEVLCRGQGDFSDAGHGHLYATSPWIESYGSVSLERAPRIGASGARLIKTHMPVDLCPWTPEARYVYVTRHPVACFASCVDFLRLLAGPAAPPLPGLVDWFCSERMWWRPWPEHVEGWWRRAEQHPNVLFVHYEEMLRDLPGVVDAVAALLGVELRAGERAEVVRKSGFDFMKAHEGRFEMAAPTFFSVSEGAFLVHGGGDRQDDVGPAEAARIRAFCRDALREGRYPLARFYPDVAEGEAERRAGRR